MPRMALSPRSVGADQHRPVLTLLHYHEPLDYLRLSLMVDAPCGNMGRVCGAGRGDWRRGGSANPGKQARFGLHPGVTTAWAPCRLPGFRNKVETDEVE